jgi:predicted metal-dependent hydrolase
MHVTPDICRAAYDYLRSTAPFKRWGLPSGEQVSFIISKQAKPAAFEQDVGSCSHDKNGDFTLRISLWNDGSDLLIMTIAHEMCHMRQAILKGFTATPYDHKADFKRMAEQVCKQHKFNRNYF